MRLGNFSVSLAVKDIAASPAFYEKLGFRVIMGDQSKNWLILQNETSTCPAPRSEVVPAVGHGHAALREQDLSRNPLDAPA